MRGSAEKAGTGSGPDGKNSGIPGTRVWSFDYIEQIASIAALRERGELHEALGLALQCVTAAESDVVARVAEATEAGRLEDILRPPIPSITWLACQLCRELGEYRIEISLIERWLAHRRRGQGSDSPAEAQMMWRLATAVELLRTGQRPTWSR